MMNWRFAPAIGFLVVLSTIVLGSKMWGFFAPMDEATLMVYPDLILRGFLPYRDFAATYPPGNFYVLGAIFKIFGDNLYVERAVGIVYQCLMVIAIYCIGLRASQITALVAALIALTTLLYFPVAGAYSMFGGLALALFALLSATKTLEVEDAAHRLRCALIAGALAGSTFWFRQEVGAIVTAASIVAMGPPNVKRLGFYSLGFSLPISAGALFVLIIGPSVVFDSLVLDVSRMVPGRRLPIQFGPGLLGLMGCALISVISALTLQQSRSGQQAVWLARAIALMSVALLPSVLQRVDQWHITYVGSTVFALAAVSFSLMLRQLNLRSPLDKIDGRALLAVCVVALLALTTWRAVNRQGTSYRIESQDRWVLARDGIFSTDRQAREHMTSLLADLNRDSRPGEKLFVGPRDLRFAIYNDTFFYYLLPHLQPASRYLEMSPGIANRPNSRLAEQIASADWIILTSRYDRWREPNASMSPGPNQPNEVVERDFCVQADYGAWQLLHQCRQGYSN